jgi:histidinol-phosphate aminotransferase
VRCFGVNEGIKKLVREGIEDLVPYPPGKPIEELERELGIRNSIKLASNENPLGPSPLAVQAIREKLQTLHRYPDGSGYYLKHKLSQKCGLSPAQIILGNGSNELIELMVRTFLTAGEHAIQPFPTFLVYEKMVRAAGGRITSVPLSDFKIDLEGILAAVTPKTKIIFLSNPNNPTGSALTEEEIKNFLNRIPHKIMIAMDEAYVEFVSDVRVASGARLLGEFPLLFVLRTFSKLYGLAGLRIGYGFGNAEVIDYMNRVRQPFNANSLAQAAATAALDDEAFVSRTLALIREGLEYLCRCVGELGIEYVPSQTNFFLIKVKPGGRTVYEKMLREGVIVRSMESYGLPEYIRVNVGLPEENERFVTTLKKVLGR